MKKNILLTVLLFSTAVFISGCGGGGGGSTTNPVVMYNFVLTGTLRDLYTNDLISGAVVTIASKTATTGTNGRFSIGFDERPLVTTYCVDGTMARPCESGYYDFYCIAEGRAQNAQSIELPLAPAGGMDLGEIKLVNRETTPPPPVFE